MTDVSLHGRVRRACLRGRMIVYGVLVLLAGLGIRFAAASTADPCDSYSIGTTPALADTDLVEAFCDGLGQVFTATDTLIHSISVWRPAVPVHDMGPYRLFIAKTDSTRRPEAAVHRTPLLNGVTLIVPVSDSLNAVEYRYTFDPPFQLPRRGRFALDILSTELSMVHLLGTTTNAYQGGQAWKLGPDLLCIPGTAWNEGPNVDVVFQVEFCRGVPTRTERHGWGELKLLYR